MPDQKQPQEPQSQEFGLKRSESELLIFVKTHQDAVFSALLSTIASDRLAYQVTENTQFNLSDNMTKITITERSAPPAEPPAAAEGKNPVKTAE